jgi:hypothetical protein
MASVGERWKALLTAVRHRDVTSSAWWPVPGAHRLDPAAPAEIFVADEHYFVVRLHQVHLATPQEWFARYDPLLFVHTEFMYAGERRREPFVVGPDTLRNKVQQTPAGMNVSDLQATALRPYRGGGLELTVVLCRTKIEDAARRLLSIAERCLVLPQLSVLAGPYVQVAEAGLDALEAVLGLDDVVPMLGALHGFDSAAGFRPNWFVLSKTGALTKEQTWVRDNRLWCGTDPGRLTEPDVDFVLCSLGQTPARDDVGQLSEFRGPWNSALSYANQSAQEAWEVAKALLAALQLTVRQSADLTRSQAADLVEEYQQQLVSVHKLALKRSMLSPPSQEPDPLTHSLASTLSL